MSIQQQIGLHGTFLCIHNCGVLITGPSGCGKSELALQLIDRGHQLIADDLVNFKRHPTGIVGYASELGIGFLMIRELGLIDVEKLYSPAAIKSHHDLSLIIELTPDMTPSEALPPTEQTQDVLEHPIPHYSLTHSPARPLALLIEGFVCQLASTKSSSAPWDKLMQDQQAFMRVTS